MNLCASGRYKTQVFVDSMRVLCDDKYLYNTRPFKLNVEFLFEPELRFTEDEPGCAEYIEVISASTVGAVPFGVDCEYYVTEGDNFLAMLSCAQVESLEDMILQQGKRERYSDPDNYRPVPDERIRLELGWGFNDE